jgi:hypothetical protein
VAVKGTTDSTVAIVAILTTGLVGFVGPAIAGLFNRGLQRAEQRHARALDDLAERRKVIFGAIEGLARFDWTLSKPTTPPEADELAEQFTVTWLRLGALLGEKDPLVTSYSNAVGHIVLALRLERDAADGADEARAAANKVRDAMVAMAGPYLRAVEG